MLVHFMMPIVITSCIALIGLIAYRLQYPVPEKDRVYFSVAELTLSFFASGILMMYMIFSLIFFPQTGNLMSLLYFINPLVLTLIRLGVVYTTGHYDTELSVAVIASALFSGFYTLLVGRAFR